ncbi:MAG TPA: potassium channel family protein [Xanthobacteraceae bacterium]|nr:potassium channel family protein [Xanthobacteraceae bacterium]
MSAVKPTSTLSLKDWRGRVKEWHEVTREPGLTALLVVESLLIFIIIPLTAMGTLPAFVLPAMFLLLIISILVVTWQSPIAAILVTAAVALSAGGTFLWREHPSALTEWLSAGGRLLAITAVSVIIARAVFAGGHVTIHRVQGAVVLYLNFALVFFTIYRLMEVLLPRSFSNLPHSGSEFGSGAALLYFSFTTLTSLGFGDITPVHPLARSLANLEGVIGQLYPATLLARLVSLEIEHRRQTKG